MINLDGDDDSIKKLLENLGVTEPAQANAVKKVVKKEAKKISYGIIFNTYAIVMLILFACMNISILWLIKWLALMDVDLLKCVNGYQRVITDTVVIALITGVVAQTAAVLIIITNYFFGKNNLSDTSSISATDK